MFKYIKKGDQILALQAELRALKSNVGKALTEEEYEEITGFKYPNKE